MVKLLLVISGIIVLGFGITLGVIANVILNSGEAFVKALSDVIRKEFSNVKIAFDVSWVAFSVVLSLFFFGGELVGTREGTILSAIFTGVAVKFWLKLIKTLLNELYADNKKGSLETNPNFLFILTILVLVVTGEDFFNSFGIFVLG